MAVETLRWEEGLLKIIDQTKLPLEFTYIYCQKVKEVVESIKRLSVRGAPAIGIAAAYGVVIGANEITTNNCEEFYNQLDEVINYLASSRPTAVNLFWALEKMKKKAYQVKEKPLSEIKKILEEEAVFIHNDDKRRCQKIGEYGANLIKDGDAILTHCNAGALATGGMGTALSAIYTAKEQGKRISVFADETRPLLQGARLTSWELMQDEIDVTLICDNMAATLMKQGKINLCLVGADRIAKNGDTANKIGTYQVAILAKEHRIPFYVAAPFSTVDFNTSDGLKIPIEERSSEEVTMGLGKRIAPERVKVYNPAFDVTPFSYIKAIITEKGIASPPFEESLFKLSQDI
ncbi:S-methyl-5-thioribose-1-phosphate isomerase [bacterium]|nr:S-methyl-5-thioribose-1-phosphate isomerase [bacterium]